MKTPPRNSSLSESVYEHIKGMLLTLQLKPGDKVPENKIATQLGISRTPIREALRRLESEGVINIYPNRFAEVITMDDNYVRQLGQTRIAIDTMLTKLAVYYGSNADFNRLRQLADICTEAAKTDDNILRTKSDEDFHMELANISRNQLLIKFQSNLSLRVALLIVWKYLKIDNRLYEESLAHQKLAEALMARDEKLAVKIATDHLISFYSMDDDLPYHFWG
jgi:DNA-binding GntR family transcriptional regulator